MYSILTSFALLVKTIGKNILFLQLIVAQFLGSVLGISSWNQFLGSVLGINSWNQFLESVLFEKFKQQLAVGKVCFYQWFLQAMQN